jgi:hypothetical protein
VFRFVRCRICIALVVLSGGHICRASRHLYGLIWPNSAVPAPSSTDPANSKPSFSARAWSHILSALSLLVAVPVFMWTRARAVLHRWHLLEEWDPLDLRQPYGLEQDMRLEVHRCQLRLKWRSDLPKPADYPLVALYLK